MKGDAYERRDPRADVLEDRLGVLASMKGDAYELRDRVPIVRVMTCGFELVREGSVPTGRSDHVCWASHLR